MSPVFIRTIYDVSERPEGSPQLSRSSATSPPNILAILIHLFIATSINFIAISFETREQFVKRRLCAENIL